MNLNTLDNMVRASQDSFNTTSRIRQTVIDEKRDLTPAERDTVLAHARRMQEASTAVIEGKEVSHEELTQLTVKELRKEAEERGVELPSHARKDDIIEAIEEGPTGE